MKYFVTALLLLVGAGQASAQLTFTSSDFINQNQRTTTTYSSTDLTGLAAIIAKAGTGQTWDFGGRIYDAGQVNVNGVLLPYPSGAAMATNPNFTTATHVIADTSYQSGARIIQYSFVRITSSGVWILGESQDSAGVPSITSIFSPAFQLLKLPLSYGTSWTASSNFIDSQGDTAQFSEVVTVDAEGTLSTPSSPPHAALRTKTKQTISITYGGFTIPLASSYSFDWRTKEGYSANISTDSSLNPTSVSYTDPVGTITAGGAAWQSGTVGDFGTVMGGSTNNMTFTLLDTGAVTITIQNVTVSGPDASEFSVIGTYPQTVMAGGSQGIEVRWTPSSTTGTHTATLNVALAENKTLTLNLVGMVAGNVTTGAAWQAGTTGEFGTVSTTTPVPMTLTLVDTSASSIEVSGVTFTGANASEFSVAGTFPQTVLPAATLPLVVTWTPTATTGTHRATMNVSLGSSLPPVTLELTGTVSSSGVADRGTAPFQISVWPNPIAQSGKISVTSADGGSIEWSIVDQTGRVQYSEADNVAGGANVGIAIPTERVSLANGQYFLNAKMAGHSVTIPIVISR